MPSIADLERLLAKDPGDAFVLYGLAQEHAKHGRFQEAVAYYDKCLTIDPAYCYAYFHKAKALEAAGRESDAVAALTAGLAAAKAARDQQAIGEIQGYLDELSP